MNANIVTRTGDTGETDLASGQRVAKNDTKVRTLGVLDELNANIGLLLSFELPAEIKQQLAQVQNDLFIIGSEVAGMENIQISPQRVDKLEESLDLLDAELEPLTHFILPGGSAAASQCHVVRAVCRRVERELVAASKCIDLSQSVIPYINRLSDWLFVAARWLNKKSGNKEMLWKHP